MTHQRSNRWTTMTVLALTLGASVTGPGLLIIPAHAQNQAEIDRFCTNIVDEAREQRYAIQREELQALRAEIEDKITVLEEKRAELEKWATMREQFASAASEGLVAVYSNMRPDAAAQRLEELPSGLSAALLTKLKPRTSAAILNEMSTEQAALITQIMAAVGDTSMMGEGG